MNRYKSYGKGTNEFGRARGREFIYRERRGKEKIAKVIRMSCGTGGDNPLQQLGAVCLS